MRGGGALGGRDTVGGRGGEMGEERWGVRGGGRG